MRWTEGLQSSWCMLPEKLGVMPRNLESFPFFHEIKLRSWRRRQYVIRKLKFYQSMYIYICLQYIFMDLACISAFLKGSKKQDNKSINNYEWFTEASVLICRKIGRYLIIALQDNIYSTQSFTTEVASTTHCRCQGFSKSQRKIDFSIDFGRILKH